MIEEIIIMEVLWRDTVRQLKNLPFAFLPPFSSAHVGCRSHCGRGPCPCCLSGILYLQEVHQQGHEAQEGP